MSELTPEEVRDIECGVYGRRTESSDMSQELRKRENVEQTAPVQDDDVVGCLLELTEQGARAIQTNHGRPVSIRVQMLDQPEQLYFGSTDFRSGDDVDDVGFHTHVRFVC